jgi:WD40 repeat protein
VTPAPSPRTPKTNVFLSYSRVDSEFADRLEATLRSKGVTVLIDRIEIYAFEDWWKRIENLITLADAIVFIISPDFAHSDICRKETTFAAGLSKRLAPIVAHDCEYEAIPDELRRLNFIFFNKESSFEESASHLVEGLETNIEWVRKHTEFGKAAREWDLAHRPSGLLLRSPLLEVSETWIGQRAPDAPPPSQLVFEFISESRRASTRRLRWTVVISIAITMVATTLSIIAWQQRAEARRQRSQAQQQRDEAILQRSIAEDRFTRLSVANGERLLSQGDLPGAALWFANPLSVHPKDEAIHRQRIAILSDMYPRLTHVLPHESMVKEMQLDDNGSRLTTIAQDLSIRIWDLGTGTWSTPPVHQSGKATNEVLSADGKTIAILVPKQISEQEIHAILQRSKTEAKNAEEAKTLSQLKSALGEIDPTSELKVFDMASGKLVRKLVVKAGYSPNLWAGPHGTLVIAGKSSLMGMLFSGGTSIWRPGPRGSSTTVADAVFDMVAFSPDGKSILGGELGGRWHLVTSAGEVLATGVPKLTGGEYLRALAMCPTGLRFATVTTAGRITLWDAVTGQPFIEELESDKANRDMQALTFSPDGRWLAGVGGFLDEKTLRVWDTSTGKLILTITLPEPGRSVSFSPGGRYLLTTTEKSSSMEGEARVWDLGTGLPATPAIASVYAAQWGRDPDTIITAGSDKTVKIWKLFDSSPILSLAQQEALRNGRLSSDRQVLVAEQQLELKTFPIDSFDRADFSLHKQRKSVSDQDSFALNDNGSLGVVASDNESSVYDLVTQRRLLDFPHKDSTGWVSMHDLNALEIGRDGKTVMVGGGGEDTGRILVWNALTGKGLPTLVHAATVNSANFSPDGRSIVSSSADGTARIWDTASGKQRSRLEHGNTDVAYAVFSPDNQLIATAAADGMARVWHADTGKLSGDPMRHEGAVEFVAFSPDGHSLLTLARLPDGVGAEVRLWDSVTQKAKAAAELGPDTRGKAAFSPDGRYVITPDGQVGFRLWSAATMEAMSPHLDSGWEGVRGDENSFLPRQRTLVVSKDSKGLPLLLGIGSGGASSAHAIAPWSLPFDNRPSEAILRELELMASRRIDSTGALVVLTPAEIKARLEEVRIFKGADDAPKASWYRREAEECIEVREWYGAVWNIDHFLALEPQNAEASLQLDKGRSLAELERWTEAAAAFDRARALGASDLQTLPQIARLLAVTGSAHRQGLAGSLINLARKSNDTSQRLDLLRAAMVAMPQPLATGDQTAAMNIVKVDLDKAKDPSDRARLRDLMGEILYRSGDFKGAIEKFDESGRGNYSGKNTWYFAAMARWRVDDRKGALKDLEDAQGEMKRLAAERRYRDGLWASSLYWYEWVELSALEAEASALIH